MRRKHPALMALTRALRIAMAIPFIGTIPSTALGQALASASLTGKVIDGAGSSIPGAKVTVTGPALQIPQVNSVTDAEGNYTIVDLPAPGTYRIAFAAVGFQTYVQSEVHLTVGLTGKVDATMKIGAVSDVVEVSGSNPVLDPVSVTNTATLPEAEIKDVPRGLRTQELLTQTPGVGMAGPPDVGDSNFGTRYNTVTYGVVLNPTLSIEGMNTSIAKNATGAVFVNGTGVAEAEFTPSGNNADIAFPGVNQDMTLKSGGNTFHGNVQADYENPSFQGNNINAVLAAPPNSLTLTNPLTETGFYDYAANIGGFVIRNKLWFFGGYSTEAVTQGSAGYVGAPDASGNWLGSTAPPATVHSANPQYNYKVSYQVSKNTQIIWAHLHGDLYNSNNSPGRFRPLPNGTVLRQPGSSWHGEVQTSIGKKLLFDGLFGHAGYHVRYSAEPASALAPFGFADGADFPGSPSQDELSNGLTTGPASQLLDRPNNRYELKAIGTFIPSGRHWGGTHQFKFGTTDDWEYAATAVDKDKPSGDYLLQFQNGVPNKITVYNYPYPTSMNAAYSQAGYITDKWVIHRVALNVGIRAERYHSFYPDQDGVAGQFSNLFPVQHYPYQSILTWSDIVPRAGIAWDIRGDGKTIIKASVGLFGDTMGSLFAATFNPNAAKSITYNWNGPCAPTAANAPVEYKCDVTPTFLASLPGLTPISQTGAQAQVLNPNLKADKTHEYTVKIERELVRNVSANFTYVHHSLFNVYDAATNAGSILPTQTFTNNGVDVGHPYSSWNIPVVFNDTFEGVTTPVTVYTYAKNSGTSASEVVNNPSNRPDKFDSFEMGITKRYSQRFTGFASFWTTKDHRWIQGTAGIVGSPNDDPFPLDTTWNWEARFAGIYYLPKGFLVSSLFRAQSGTPGQRISKFNSSALNQGSTTIRLGPFGEFRGPVVPLLNVKIAKIFTFHDRFKLEANGQLFNVINSSANVTTNYQTGASTFDVASDILSPRVLRLGGNFSF
jgi:Carboxypeptidase regulatory-like domain